MSLRELIFWAQKFQLHRLQESEVIKFKCPGCGANDQWEYDFDRLGHICKKCGFFQEDM